MRLSLLMTITAAAGLSACAPVPVSPYGYAPSAPGYGYNGAYAPGSYYPEPAYAPGYVAPGPAIIIGGERRYDDRERYERQRNEGAYRGNPNQNPGGGGRDFGRGQPPQNPGFNRPAPAPVAARPAPQGAPPPSGGAAAEQWSRTHVNAAPSAGDSGPH